MLKKHGRFLVFRLYLFMFVFKFCFFYLYLIKKNQSYENHRTT